MRYPKNWPKDVPKPPPVPRRWFEDMQWMSEHILELTEQYPDQWVAVFHGKVVAAGKDAGQVQRLAQEKTGERDIAMDLVETGRKFYSPWRILRDQA
jgi:hypothetical protein